MLPCLQDANSNSSPIDESELEFEIVLIGIIHLLLGGRTGIISFPGLIVLTKILADRISKLNVQTFKWIIQDVSDKQPNHHGFLFSSAPH